LKRIKKWRMNLRKILFIILCSSVVGVWVVVFNLAVPTGAENIASKQPFISEYTHIEKKMIYRDKSNTVQVANEFPEKTKEVSGVLRDAAYHLSSDGSISVDVLLAALEDIDSK